jgi:bifunctional enzyme CysN/CysC
MSERAHRPQLKIVIVGHVDHGKSTLVGRLIHDTGSLPDGKMAGIEAMCARRGMPFEWAFLMDALQAERDQGVTIDTTQIRFTSDGRDYVIIDAPGHKEFLKNMVTGAAMSEAALLLIDAEEGVREQSRRHGYLLHLLGVRQVAVLVNKMDRVGFDADRFGSVVETYRAYLDGIGVEPTCFVPISARDGDNVASPSARMPWYQGPTALGALAAFTPLARPVERPLRMPVQDVYKFDERRIIAGRIVAGRLRVGDEVLFSPSNLTGRVRSLEAWSVSETRTEAVAGESVGITLEEQIFVERGDVMSHLDDLPVETNVFRGRLFWLGHRSLKVDDRLRLKLHTTESDAVVQSIERVIDTGDLAAREASEVERNAVAEVVLRTRGLIALDEHEQDPQTGRFVLLEDYVPVAGGIISMEGYPDQREQVTRRSTNITAVGHGVTRAARASRAGHDGGVLWFTGLSGAGKSTLALALEARLFAKGYEVYVLDGDNVRSGLNANLGFSPEDRAENIRRVGEVAGLFADAGMIVISSFISPYRADRERAREAVDRLRTSGDHELTFHEIHIEAPLEVCEQRDPKGLYEKARAGKIPEFTGISSPYEPPEEPDLVVPTGTLGVEECLQELVAYVERRFAHRR